MPPFLLSRSCRAGLLLAAICAALAGCDRGAGPASRPTPVHLVTANAATDPAAATFSGTLVPRIESQLSFRVPGRMTVRRADAGMAVARGEVLARLDDTPFKLAVQEAAAELAQAQATLARLRRDVERNRALAQSGAVARADFDALQTQQAATQAQVHGAQSRLERARNDLAYTALTAPAAGTVALVQAEPGQVVAAGTPVLRLARAGEQEVQVDVPEGRIGLISPAQPATVRLLSLPQAEWAGTVREIASVADPATRTYRVRVAVAGLPEAARLGMSASVRFEPAGAEQSGPLQLPISALFQHQEQPAVWVLPDDARHLVLRPVVLAGMGTDTIAVAAGIAPGERVVAAGVHRLDAGMAVQAWDGQLP